MTYDLDQLRRMLPVDKNNLDEELERQAHIQDVIGRKVAQLGTVCNQAKDVYATACARLTNDLGQCEGRKLTKDQVEAQVQRHPERCRTWDAYQRARQELEEWQSLLDAWRGRSFLMTNLTHLYGADYFTTTKTSTSFRGGTDDEYAELRNRAAQARGRRRLGGGA